VGLPAARAALQQDAVPVAALAEWAYLRQVDLRHRHQVAVEW
jgi:hypothetical protein